MKRIHFYAENSIDDGSLNEMLQNGLDFKIMFLHDLDDNTINDGSCSSASQ